MVLRGTCPYVVMCEHKITLEQRVVLIIVTVPSDQARAAFCPLGFAFNDLPGDSELDFLLPFPPVKN